MKILKLIISDIWAFVFLYRTNAPIWVIFQSFWLSFSHRISNHISPRGKKLYKNLNQRRDEFIIRKANLNLDNDWFTSQIPTWLRAFDDERIYDRSELNCLEIGSWQGLSAFFILSELPNARLTCVDTWEGSDEHQDGAASSPDIVSESERTFESNLAIYNDRLYKFKGTSFSYFHDRFEYDKFDLIYIDGSHHSDDVIIDAIKSFESLKVGGLMIFDDYFWSHYKIEIENAAGAINAFLRIKGHRLKIIEFDYQLIVKKISKTIR